ncbi:hypothetical protein [Aequorivita antarctica]|uniref:Uncharacterized protein n=1 Tax=Aequorivita antarctica TaxID=153266 RepID=A0A5C6Z497_9FLAO|nr:hypothetical protein [Aequorivita antarctica]TXD74264.1 hypothetical protein ESU54_03150 [Aequorivita antarctica]SRX73604.1 hypothetical protein AEQU3_01036 [Aequorivita antarctica]
MKTLIAILFTFNSILSYGQSTKVDNTFQLEVKKVDQRSRLFQMHFKGYYIRIPEDSKKIQFKLKAKSLTNEKETFNPNNLYVVLRDKNLRLRPFDGDFIQLVDVKPDDKTPYYGYHYNPEVTDTFKDYQMEGFKDVETCIDYGTNKKPHIKPIYFNTREFKTETFNLYFAMPKDQISGELYYGNIKLMDFKLD